MGLFDKFKEVTNRVREVESNLYNEKRDYLEIYERNQQLEQEIKERTSELHDANRRMLTLQHIWDMMNSSTPLENVLEAIVNSTQGELGYMHCAIIRKCKDSDGDFCRIIVNHCVSSIVFCGKESIQKRIHPVNKMTKIMRG